MKAFARAGSPARGWGTSPGTGSPRREGGSTQAALGIAVATDICRHRGYLSVTAPLQRHRKLWMDGEASRCGQGRGLLPLPGLGGAPPHPSSACASLEALLVFLPSGGTARVQPGNSHP